MDLKEKTELAKLLESMDTDITVDNTGAVSGTIDSGYSSDTITLSSPDLWDSTTYNTAKISSTVFGGGHTYANANLSLTGAVGSITGGPYTINGGAGSVSPWATYTSAPKINLNGEGADIEVNGWSLVDAIKKIEERLNILTPNENLESEWSELQTLGEQYRKLEQHILDKQATWDRLKAMPPPAID
jgi:hypothetical protein